MMPIRRSFIALAALAACLASPAMTRGQAVPLLVPGGDIPAKFTPPTRERD